MAYNPQNPNGQTTAANSQPVVIASDQSTINTSDVSVVNQGTATAALKGYLELGAVTTSAPSYTNGQASALSLTTSGNLRVDGSAVTQPISGSVTADTELPAAAALADGTSNPTAPFVADAMSTYNGATWDRVRSIDALSGTGANNTVPGIIAVGTGPGYAHRYNPTALAAALNSASTIEVEGGNTMTWAIVSTATTQGTFIFEGTSDGSNWINVEVFDASIDQWVSGQNITAQTSVGKVFHVACGGYRQIRMRVSSALTGGSTISHTVNVTNSQQLLAGVDTGAAPHNFGYTLVHKDGEYSTTQTTTALWTPTTGKRFAVTDLTISTGGTTAGIVTIYDAAAATAYSVGTTPAIFRGEFSPSATAKPGMVKSFNVPYYSAAVNNRVHVTTSAAMTVYIQLNGYEI